MYELISGLGALAVIGAIAYMVGGVSWRVLTRMPASDRIVKKTKLAETVALLGVLAILVSALLALLVSLVAMVVFVAERMF